MTTMDLFPPVVNEDLLPYEHFFRPKFLSWLADNPHVYAAFQAQALHFINSGRAHFSARTIVQFMRDMTRVSESNGWGGWKINDHHSPDMARVFVIRHPHYRHFWEYRRGDWEDFLAALPPVKPKEDDD